MVNVLFDLSRNNVHLNIIYVLTTIDHHHSPRPKQWVVFEIALKVTINLRKLHILTIKWLIENKYTAWGSMWKATGTLTNLNICSYTIIFFSFNSFYGFIDSMLFRIFMIILYNNCLDFQVFMTQTFILLNRQFLSINVSWETTNDLKMAFE